MGVAVAVLNPQDCLKQPFSRKPLLTSPSQPKHQRNPNSPNSNRSNRKSRRSPTGSRSTAPTVEKPVNRLVNAGVVKILKRGEDLDLAETAPDLPSPIGLLGPAPEKSGPRRGADSDRLNGFYAGSSSCILSPPPSSLPLPAFFAKKVQSSANSEATNALLKILRLDLE